MIVVQAGHVQIRAFDDDDLGDGPLDHVGFADDGVPGGHQGHQLITVQLQREHVWLGCQNAQR